MMKHWEKKAKGWVFLSHSSEDYEEVKVVRNYLEENGFSALMFYLKCLEDKKKHLREELIASEIESRNIFVLCNSKYASQSNWVTWETNLVKNSNVKIFREIDMDKLKYQKCTQLSKLDDLMNNATLYFLYSHKDKYKVNKIYKKLESFGYRIFLDSANIKLGDNISEKIHTALDETINKGVVLIFLSKNAIESNWFWHEKDIAINSDAFIIPVVLDDVNIDNFPAFRSRQCLNIQEIDFFDQLVEKINRYN